MLGDIQTNYLYEPKVFGKGPRVSGAGKCIWIF